MSSFSERYRESSLLNMLLLELETLIGHSCDLNIFQVAIVEEPVSERKALWHSLENRTRKKYSYTRQSVLIFNLRAFLIIGACIFLLLIFTDPHYWLAFCATEILFKHNNTLSQTEKDKYYMHVCVCMLNHVQLFVTPCTVAHQAPLFMEFSRQEYCSGLPFPPPGDLPDPGTKRQSLALADRSFTTWEASYLCGITYMWNLNNWTN